MTGNIECWSLRQRKAEVENIRGRIDQDARAALLTLNAAKEQVEVAKQNVELANKGLARSKDRFALGVTDSVEVVQGEQALASSAGSNFNAEGLTKPGLSVMPDVRVQ